MAGAVPGVRRLGHPGRRIDAPAAGRRRAACAPRPAVRCRSARSTLGVAMPAADRRRRARPRARRRPRAGLGHAARRRAGHGQEHPAPPGPRPHGRAAAPAACSSPPRSRARRCGCGPSGSARSTPTCSSWPRPRCRTSSRTSRRSRPDVLALDSIQTVVDPDLPGAPGSVTQVRDCAYRLVQQAKERDARHGARRPRHQGGHARRAARARARRRHRALVRRRPRPRAPRCSTRSKHRFGSTDELGLFEMTEHGLVDVPDASARFLVDRRPGVPGSAVAAVLEGARPLLVEVQALVMRTGAPMPRRSAAGIDGGPPRDAARGARAARGVDGRPVPTCTRASPVGSASPSRGLDLALALAVAGARLGAAVTARHGRGRRARPRRRGALGAAARAAARRGGAPRVHARGRPEGAAPARATSTGSSWSRSPTCATPSTRASDPGRLILAIGHALRVS